MEGWEEKAGDISKYLATTFSSRLLLWSKTNQSVI